MKKLRTMTWIAALLILLLALAAPMHAADAAKININKASADELTQLKKVGAKVAQKIVAYREANGPFKAPEDIVNVPGIGMKILEINKDIIAVE